MSTRDDLAAALTGTGEVRVTSHYRPSIKPGEGFIKWGGRTRDDSALGWLDTWEAWVGLSNDVATAETWLEANTQTLIDALEVEAVVTAAEPVELVLGKNIINGLILTAVTTA